MSGGKELDAGRSTCMSWPVCGSGSSSLGSISSYWGKELCDSTNTVTSEPDAAMVGPRRQLARWRLSNAMEERTSLMMSVAWPIRDKSENIRSVAA